MGAPQADRMTMQALLDALADQQDAYDAYHAARERAQIQAARLWYTGVRPLRGGHPVLERAGLDMNGAGGAGIDEHGRLCVPIWRDGLLWSLCRITADGEDTWPGISLTNCQNVLDRPNATVTVRAVGFLAGLACFQSLPSCRVRVSWASGAARDPEATPGLAIETREDWYAYRVHRLTEQLARQVDGRPTHGQIVKRVNESIAATLMRSAKFLAPGTA